MAAKSNPKVKPFLFVDLSNLVYKNASNLHFLRTKDGVASGGIYGTLRSLLSWSKKFQVWVFADGRPTYRKDLLKEYKAGRSDTQLPAYIPVDDAEAKVLAEMDPQTTSLKETVYQNIDVLLEILPSFGFPLVHHSDWEADDLIGAAVFMRERFGSSPMMPEVYVVSTDKDFDQLPVHRLSSLDAHIKIATAKSPISGHSLLGAKTLANFSDIPADSIVRQYPHLLLIYRTVAGDSSDRIKSILTPSKLFKPIDESGVYAVDHIIKTVCEVLKRGGYDPFDSYLEFAWALDQMLVQGKDVQGDCDFKARLGETNLFDDETLERFITNLRVTKIPFNLLQCAEAPTIALYNKNCELYLEKMPFFISGPLAFDFEGWYPNMEIAKEACYRWQMPSIVKKLEELGLVTTTHLVPRSKTSENIS